LLTVFKNLVDVIYYEHLIVYMLLTFLFSLMKVLKLMNKVTNGILLLSPVFTLVSYLR